MEEENDPFNSVITKLYISSSQEELLQNLAIDRENKTFPNESESQSYNIAVESTGIRMESPTEEEFLTPQEDSLSNVSSQEIGKEREKDMDEFLREKGKNLESFQGVKKGHFFGEKVLDEMESGNSSKKDEFVFEKGKNLEGFEGLEMGDFGEKVFGEMSSGNEKVNMGNSDKKCVDLEEGDDDSGEFVLGKWKILKGIEESETEHFGAEKGLDKMDIEKEKVETGIEGLKKKSFDGEKGFENGKVETGVIGNSRAKDFELNEECDLNENGVETGFDDHIISTQVLDLNEDESCGDMAMENREVEICSAKSVATEVVDLSQDEIGGDLPMQNIEREMGLNENTNMEIDWDENELYGDLPMKNLVGEITPRKGDEIDKFKCISPKGVKEVDKIKSLGLEKDDSLPKGISIGGSSSVNNLPPKSQEAEIVLDESREPCIDENRGDVNRSKGFPEDTDVQRKGIGQNCKRKLPSSLDVQAENAFKEGNVSKREKNEGVIEKNKHKNDKSMSYPENNKGICSELPSSASGNLEDNLVMKNLLCALDLMGRKEKKKVNDVSDEEVDFLESAMDQGIYLLMPRWWPTEGVSE